MKRRIVITGAAGFIGSHLAEELLDRDCSVVGIDNLLTGDLANIAHLAGRDFVFIKHDVTNYINVDGPGRRGAALGQPGEPDRLSRAADSHAEGGRARHAQGARPGEGQRRAVRHRIDVGGLRRSARASAEGNLLGQREPHRPARRLRRSQALRRSDDDGVSPLSRASTRRSCASSTPTARACASRTAARCPAFISQALLNEDVTVFGDGTQTRSFCYVDDLVAGILKLMDSDLNEPVNIGNPHEMTIEGIAKTIIQMTGSKSKIIYQDLPTDDPESPPARHHHGPHAARLGAESDARAGPGEDDRLLQAEDGV